LRPVSEVRACIARVARSERIVGWGAVFVDDVTVVLADAEGEPHRLVGLASIAVLDAVRKKLLY
jgi:hypothetical protein